MGSVGVVGSTLQCLQVSDQIIDLLLGEHLAVATVVDALLKAAGQVGIGVDDRAA